MREVVRLSFPEYANMEEGLIITPAEERQENRAFLESLLTRFEEFVRPVGVGEYNLTPKVWVTNKYKHQLIVFEGDRAIIRVLPLRPDSALSRAFNLGSLTIIDIQSGGRVLRLPEEQTIFGLGGGVRDLPEPRIFEVIAVRERQH